MNMQRVSVSKQNAAKVSQIGIIILIGPADTL